MVAVEIKQNAKDFTKNRDRTIEIVVDNIKSALLRLIGNSLKVQKNLNQVISEEAQLLLLLSLEYKEKNLYPHNFKTPCEEEEQSVHLSLCQECCLLTTQNSVVISQTARSLRGSSKIFSGNPGSSDNEPYWQKMRNGRGLAHEYDGIEDFPPR